MKLIPERFEKKGFHFQLDFREGNVAIYKRWKNPQNAHWEVVVIRTSKERNFTTSTPKGEVLVKHEAQEIYPSAEDWGKRGWTYTDYGAARVKAQRLIEKTN